MELKINKELSEKAAIFLGKKRVWILSFVFLALLAYCGYLWYAYVLNPNLSEEKREEYIKTKKTEAIFNQKSFDSALEEIEKRRVEYAREIQAVPDIFRIP